VLLVDEDAVSVVKGIPLSFSILPEELRIEAIKLGPIVEILLLLILLCLDVILEHALIIQNVLSQELLGFQHYILHWIVKSGIITSKSILFKNPL